MLKEICKRRRLSTRPFDMGDEQRVPLLIFLDIINFILACKRLNRNNQQELFNDRFDDKILLVPQLTVFNESSFSGTKGF